MKANSILFPHPVLGRGDDIVVGHYVASADYAADLAKSNLKIDVRHELSNPAIEKMLKQGEASFAVEINCSATIYRQVFTSNSRVQTFEIPGGNLRDRCDIDFYIIAAKASRSYLPSGMNKDYGKRPFTVVEGDVIAFGGSGYFMVGRKWTPRKELKSVFKIVADTSSNKPMRVLLGSDAIIIYLNKADLENVKRTARIFPRSYVVSLYMPALIEALSAVAHGDIENDFPDGRPAWLDAIEARQRSTEKIKDLKISRENVLVLAQYLLDQPIGQQGAELSNARNQLSKDD